MATPVPEVTTSSPETLDGTWVGSTSGGDRISFSVAGSEIDDVELPGDPRCGLGLSSTIEIEGGWAFKGLSFKVESVGLPLLLYPEVGAEAEQVTEKHILRGRFSRDHREARGTITTVFGSDRCVQRWTATNS